MATLFDLGLIESFTPIFVFLLIWVVTYGTLELTSVLGKNKGLHAIVGLSAAILLAFSGKPQEIIKSMVPWFVLFFVFVLFLLVGMRFMFGNKGDNMLLEIMGKEKGAGWWVLIISVIIIGIAIALSVLFTRKDIFYCLVVDWALLGILLKRLADSTPVQSVVIITIVGMAFISAGIIAQIVRRKIY